MPLGVQDPATHTIITQVHKPLLHMIRQRARQEQSDMSPCQNARRQRSLLDVIIDSTLIVIGFARF